MQDAAFDGCSRRVHGTALYPDGDGSTASFCAHPHWYLSINLPLSILQLPNSGCVSTRSENTFLTCAVLASSLLSWAPLLRSFGLLLPAIVQPKSSKSSQPPGRRSFSTRKKANPASHVCPPRSKSRSEAAPAVHGRCNDLRNSGKRPDRLDPANRSAQKLTDRLRALRSSSGPIRNRFPPPPPRSSGFSVCEAKLQYVGTRATTKSQGSARLEEMKGSPLRCLSSD